MGPFAKQPIGLFVSRTAKALGRAFADVLAEAGGSEPMWLILLALKTNPDRTQRQLAETVGIREATLTHHLNSMERDGLVVRSRVPNNRRVHQVSLTEEGEAAFHRLRRAAVAFDLRLRAGISAEQLETAREVLAQLADNADR
jgi:MarR family transcriptional regulator, transcriptional regulator for hemolysin